MREAYRDFGKGSGHQGTVQLLHRRRYRQLCMRLGLEPRTTPIESPRSSGMAEAFVRTIARDYVRVSPCPDGETVMRKVLRGSPATTRFTCVFRKIPDRISVNHGQGFQ